ncbi:hypothetical protein IGB42_01174 [Andreprevotia sp. IGB-42]|uniref:type II secretion system protein N n=1 Tax=Andreprevotia sp. IGB-42 TaxID=2497473 RepID=UPI00135C98A8|nr:type II secretion system protein N [Andreprevotia sp. IGB-42]KAF0814275.1 hypothetical protein IGB42_01174 [Andreprevotia sp. IGB-42]
MKPFSPLTSIRFHTLVRVLEACTVIAIAWVLAGLFWQVPGARGNTLRLTPAALPPKAVELPWTRAQQWFGAAQASAEPQASTLSAQLLAVFAGNDRESVAIFSGIEASSVAVRVGAELQPGVKLVRVASDHAQIERNGVREDILLAQPAGGSPVNLQGGNVAAPVAPRSGEPAPVDALPVTIARGQMAAAMQTGNIADWAKGLALAKDGGLQIDNVAQQPFAKVLNLQNGDVIKSVNGKPLTQLSEISFLYTVFSQQSQVALIVQRHDNPVQLRYQIQP